MWQPVDDKERKCGIGKEILLLTSVVTMKTYYLNAQSLQPSLPVVDRVRSVAANHHPGSGAGDQGTMGSIIC